MKEVSLKEAVELIDKGVEVVVETKIGNFIPSSSDAFFRLDVLATAKFLIKTDEKHSVEKYKVYFYFGLWNPNPFVKPSKEVEVEVGSWFTEKDIIAEGLKLIGTYPKTYSATVVKLSK